MYIGKNFVGAAANAMIWIGATFFIYLMRYSDMSLLMSGVVLFVAFALSYFLLQSLDKTYAHNSQSRVDRFLTSLDDGELDALRDRLSGTPRDDGEYGSLEELLMENEVKAKRR